MLLSYFIENYINIFFYLSTNLGLQISVHHTKSPNDTIFSLHTLSLECSPYLNDIEYSKWDFSTELCLNKTSLKFHIRSFSLLIRTQC